MKISKKFHSSKYFIYLPVASGINVLNKVLLIKAQCFSLRAAQQCLADLLQVTNEMKRERKGSKQITNINVRNHQNLTSHAKAYKNR